MKTVRTKTRALTSPNPDGRSRTTSLTPEEDSLPDPDDDEVDDSLPADLWFRAGRRPMAGPGRPHRRAG